MADMLIWIISGFSLGVSFCSLFLSIRENRKKYLNDLSMRSDIKKINNTLEHLYAYFSLRYR